MKSKNKKVCKAATGRQHKKGNRPPHYSGGLPHVKKTTTTMTTIKYELTWLNGEEAEIYETLNEAKAQVDKYRESHELDYGLIRTIAEDGELGDWGDFTEDWEYDDE